MESKTWLRRHEYQIGSGPVVIAKASAGRTSLQIANAGSNPVHISTRPDVSVDDGITIEGNGSLSMTLTFDYALVISEWSAVAPEGNTALTVFETVERMQGD